jgi:hypothetical protein
MRHDRNNLVFRYEGCCVFKVFVRTHSWAWTWSITIKKLQEMIWNPPMSCWFLRTCCILNGIFESEVLEIDCEEARVNCYLILRTFHSIQLFLINISDNRMIW